MSRRWRVSSRPLILGLMLLLLAGTVSAVWAEPGIPYDVQRIDAADLGMRHPLGVAYVSSGPGFMVTSSSRAVRTNLFWDPIQYTTQRPGCVDYANSVYLKPLDAVFALDCAGRRLVPVERTPAGLQTGRLRYYRAFDLSVLDIADPRGLAFDPVHHALYILDAGRPAIVRLESDRRNSFAAGAALIEGRLSVHPLEVPSTADLRGLAFHPVEMRFYTLDAWSDTLYTWSAEGVSSGRVDIGGIFIRDARSLVFAPSSDSTDSTTNYNLFIADSGSGIDANLPGQIIEIHLGD